MTRSRPSCARGHGFILLVVSVVLFHLADHLDAVMNVPETMFAVPPSNLLSRIRDVPEQHNGGSVNSFGNTVDCCQYRYSPMVVWCCYNQVDHPWLPTPRPSIDASTTASPWWWLPITTTQSGGDTRTTPSTTSSPTGSWSACPWTLPGWIHVDNRHFFLPRPVPQPISWHQAEATALEHGAVLAKVTSQHDDQVLSAIRSCYPDGTRLWLGGHDLAGQWMWADGTQISGYTNWSPSFMEAIDMGSGLCIQLHLPGSKWNPASCIPTPGHIHPDTASFAFIAEKSEKKPLDPEPVKTTKAWGTTTTLSTTTTTTSTTSSSSSSYFSTPQAGTAPPPD